VHLDATQRHALRLVHRDGYSVAAAARVLAVHPRTLARQLQRTVQRLRRALEALGYDVESLLRSRCQ
jgi:DNA-directed RNA polymerase specialized sigma24 family protein